MAALPKAADSLFNFIHVILGIAIRHSTSGLSFHLIDQAFTSGTAMIWFAISGLTSYLSFMAWYKGNSMTGVALGMATNTSIVSITEISEKSRLKSRIV